MSVKSRVFSAILGTAAIVAGACAPAAGPSSGAPGIADKPVTKKVLTIADSGEPSSIIKTFMLEKATAGNNMFPIVHDGLTRSPEYQVNIPMLAAEIPSIEKGTWRVNPDGTMDTTWKLRPNVKWHDGAPFTSADLAFTFKASRDTDIAGLRVAASDALVASVSAPDKLTLIMHWNSPYVEAYKTGVGEIVPQHLFEDMYLKDKTVLTTTPLVSTEFIGLGPYKLVKWERGSFLEMGRFDDYYLGRPPLDTIYARFVSDPNTMVANILAGAVDFVIAASSSGISLDQAVEVKKRWEGTGNQVLTIRTGSAFWAEAQYRAEYSRPMDGVSDLRVRKALLQAIDLQALAEVETHGLSPIADSYFMPDEPRRGELESSIAKFAFNPTRAMQLLNEAGWQRGPDGTLARLSDGQRFEIEFWARAGPNDRVAAVITDDWKRIGIAATPYIIPAVRRTDREYEGKRPGYLCCVTVGVSSFYDGKLHQRQISSEATRWNGINYGGYANPKADALLDQLAVTLDPRVRLPLERDLMQEYTANVAMIPMWWAIYPQLALAGVKGPKPNASSAIGNIFEWDKE